MNEQFENDEALKKLIAQQKQLKEHSDRIEQIPRVSPVIKGIDMDKYSREPWKPSTAPLPIPKKLKMPDIPKYDGTTDPRDHKHGRQGTVAKINEIKPKQEKSREFHNDHGHKTADCRLLQGEVENLLKQGYSTELFSEKGKQTYMKNTQEPPKPPSPKRMVNVISGVEEINGVTYTTAKKVSKITVTHGKQVQKILEEDSITFDDTDAYGMLTPYNDAQIISVLVHDTNVKRVLVDPGSSVNIILLRVVNEMQANDTLIPKPRTLSGFDNSSVVTNGKIILTTFAEGVIKDTKFQVVEMDINYNMILGRLWIHKMDIVPSTLHQVIKFPS
ncbi:uncharacterized protein [Nicotiana sylvestris]|uniref:uncharacterized protein n=1 Tax=Nicotiana sylvestris TaxID=4096 RepID=UPI00388C9BDB